MPRYRKLAARRWGRENMQGCVNVTIPSYSSDLQRLNEAGIRHDIRRAIELGFEGTLLVSEVNITLAEYQKFTQWAADEARGRLHLVMHAAFNTLEENIRAANMAAEAGADYVLLSYPANFYPTHEEEVFDYTKVFCDGTDLGVMLFPVPLWNFGRLHPADIAPEMLERLVAEVPNIIAIKAEGAMPLLGGLLDVYRRLKDEVVISCPLEKDVIPLMAVTKFQYSGTSNFEYYGDVMPRMFKAAKSGDMDAAMKLYWQIQPARQANATVNSYVPGTLFLNRMMWKFQGWLSGMNGGPLRQPTMKIGDSHMAILRRGAEAAGLNPTKDPNSAFFVGRCQDVARRAVA